MSSLRKKYAVALLNLMLLWGAWYVSGYGVMVGRSGNIGRNCLYVTARGFYDQTELLTTSAQRDVPTLDNCAAVYSFDVK